MKKPSKASIRRVVYLSGLCAVIFPMALVALGAASTAPESKKAADPVKTSADKAAPASTAIAAMKAAQLKDALAKAKGKVVVLNFWATFCPPCVAEMPEFVAFHKAYTGKDVVLLSVNCDDPSTISGAVKTFIEAKKINFPVSNLDDGPDEVSKVIGTTWDGALPATFIYDATGKFVKAFEGQISGKDLSGAVDPLLPKKGAAK